MNFQPSFWVVYYLLVVACRKFWIIANFPLDYSWKGKKKRHNFVKNIFHGCIGPVQMEVYTAFGCVDWNENGKNTLKMGSKWIGSQCHLPTERIATISDSLTRSLSFLFVIILIGCTKFHAMHASDITLITPHHHSIHHPYYFVYIDSY